MRISVEAAQQSGSKVRLRMHDKFAYLTLGETTQLRDALSSAIIRSQPSEPEYETILEITVL